MIALVAAVAQNRVIGKDGSLPWNLPRDLAHFKSLTAGNIVIMGRRTFESVGALPGRECIVLSKTCVFAGENVRHAQSVSDALALAKNYALGETRTHAKNENGAVSANANGGARSVGGIPVSAHGNDTKKYRCRDIFFCGGSRVYEEAIPLCEKLFITELHADFDGDTFFPEFDKSRFTKKILSRETAENFSYDFVVYEIRN